MSTAQKAARLVDAYEGMQAMFPGLAGGDDVMTAAVEVARGYRDLLAACKQMLDAAEWVAGVGFVTPFFSQIAVENARAAIARAEGGAP